MGYYEPKPFVGLPEIFIASNKKMISLFKKYGTVCTFDTTFNIIKELTPNNGSYALGCLLGQGPDLSIMPFALVIISRETKETYLTVFRKIFWLMESQPTTIITDEHRSIIQALLSLKETGEWSGQHLLDSYHILKNLKKGLQNKSHISIFAEAISARN